MARPRSIGRALVAAAALALAAAPIAAAGPPGKWTEVTAPSSNTLEIGLARTPDGVLHVLWTRDDSPQGSQATVLNTRVSADATTVSEPAAVVTYPGGTNESTALVPAPEGLRAFFSGLHPNNPRDEVMATATSADGQSWSQAAVASDNRNASASKVYVASGIGGAIAGGNTPVSIWGDSAPGEAGYHIGLNPNQPDVHFGGSSATVTGPNVAVDPASGQLAMAWNDIDADAVLAQSIDPAGARTPIPGAQAPDLLERVAMAARVGGGIYVAYLKGTNPFSSRPSIWRFGDAGSTTVAKEEGRLAGVAAAPGGRLWAFWMEPDAPRLVARRSDATATEWGAPVAVKPPSGSGAIYSTEGEASGGPLDLVALLERGGEIRNWHQRVLPGLTLKASGGKGKATFTVTDAGAPVKGATVKFAGTSKKTGSSGKVTIAAPKGKRTATASATGYAKAKATVRVK